MAGDPGEKPPDEISDIDFDSTEEDGANPVPRPSPSTSNSEAGPKKVQQKKHINIVYTYTDTGPYRVYFELKDNENGKLKINRFLVGSTLRKQEQYKRSIVDMKQAGRHRVMVFLNNYEKANTLVEEINSNKYSIFKAFVPMHLVCVTGVISGVPEEIPLLEIEEDIDCEVPIVKVQRLMRAGEPTHRISVTFRSNVLPDRVRLFCCNTRVRPFSQRVVYCGKCLRFNHRTEDCKGKRRCAKCTEQHETELEFRNCTGQQKCGLCRSKEHLTDYEGCPEKERQKNIKKLMAKQAITFIEARDQFSIWTENKYAPLENIEDFPVLEQTYAGMASGDYKYTNPLRDQWNKTNQERKKILPAVKQYNEPKKKPNQVQRKRSRFEGPQGQHEEQGNTQSKEETVNGATLNNPFAVTDHERWETIAQEEKRKAEITASQQMHTIMMSFYTDFLQQLGQDEKIKSKFQMCTQRHFNLASSVVGHSSAQK